MNTHEYLKLAEFGIELEPHSPGHDNIDLLIEVASEIPKQMEDLDNIDPATLASRCLAAKFEADTLYSRAVAWNGWREVAAQSALGKLLIDSETPVTIRKDSVKSDEKYINSQHSLKTATAYVEFYAGMKKGFEAAHYWARSKEEEVSSGTKKSGYEPHENKQKKPEQEAASDLTYS